MKLRKIFYSTTTAILIIAGVSSCSKETLNVNQNPNQPTDSTIAYNAILPAALNNTARAVATNWGWLQNWLGYWARSGTYAPSTTEESYNVTTNFQGGIWNSLYDNNYDYQTMQIQATKNGADFYAGIARIMKAHNYSILVDLYNNVPYSEALKGGGNTTPKYDKGLDIYKDLFKQIDTGIALIKSANESTTGPNKSILADDIMFGTSQYAGTTMAASKVRWAKFGNTLKLRLLVHLMNGGVLVPNGTVAGFDIAAELAKITTEGNGFLAAGENASVNPGYTNSSDSRQNPFFASYVASITGSPTQNAQYYKANSYAIEYYEWNGDPRESRFYKEGDAGLKGVAYGAPSLTENSASELAGIGPGLTKTYTAAQWILTGTESLFLQAEARNRGFIAGSADVMMQAAVTESFALVGATGAAGYLTGNATYPDVDYNGVSQGAGLPAGGLFTIITQKWFALNGIAPLEVFSDYRRVNMKNKAGTNVDHFIYGVSAGFAPSPAAGYPANSAGPAISVSPANTATQIPTRLLYPQNEYNYNPTNVGAEGTISKYGKVFWDN